MVEWVIVCQRLEPIRTLEPTVMMLKVPSSKKNPGIPCVVGYSTNPELTPVGAGVDTDPLRVTVVCQLLLKIETTLLKMLTVKL
jgi:hypothetical protein